MVPRYTFPVGSKLTMGQRSVTVTGKGEYGYNIVGNEDGEASIIPFVDLVERLKCPGTTIDTQTPKTGARLKQRLGGHASSKSLANHQQEKGRFHHALCEAIHVISQQHGLEVGNDNFIPTQDFLDNSDVRKKIAKVAKVLFGKEIHLNISRGGQSKEAWVMYAGRTLQKYYFRYLDRAPDESPLDALVPLDHLKGNPTPKICNVVRAMMTSACEEFGSDLRNLKLATVHKNLEARIWQENQKRKAWGLPYLTTPSRKTIEKHRDALLTPTEQLIATQGSRSAKNKRGRGSTDFRALLIGEVVEVDECKMSLIISAKESGIWEKYSNKQRDALEKLDEYIKSRFWIAVMLDVATRMPLGWVVTENPCAEATIALFRMATRDKTREKLMYGCRGEPAAAVGVLHVKNDNGSGLRNSTAVGALMGVGSVNTVTRAHHSAERPHVESMFGVLEIDVLNLLPGFTGARAGALPGYDAMDNGVMTVEQLYEIVTQYFIDEYPSTRHHGVAMGGRRPIEVYKAINKARGQIPPIDPHLRRINLCWEQEVTPTDEGVRVFQGIWFNSDELQEQREKHNLRGKVKVFVDPDDMNLATVVMPMVKEPIEVRLQITAFADMTLPEILRLMADLRREDPATTEFHDDQVMRTRLRRQERSKAICVEHNLPRSYSTVEECKAMGRAVFAGALTIRQETINGTKRPGHVADLGPAGDVYSLGDSDAQSDSVHEDSAAAAALDSEFEGPDTPECQEARPKTPGSGEKSKETSRPKKRPTADQVLSRPKNLKVLK